MQRLFEKRLFDWKELCIKKPLMVVGARQIEKTYTVEKFAKENFEKCFKNDFYKLQYKTYGNTFFVNCNCNNTACYLLNLSDRTTYELNITTLKDHKIRKKANIHYIVKDKFDIDVIEIMSPY